MQKWIPDGNDGWLKKPLIKIPENAPVESFLFDAVRALNFETAPREFYFVFSKVEERHFTKGVRTFTRHGPMVVFGHLFDGTINDMLREREWRARFDAVDQNHSIYDSNRHDTQRLALRFMQK